MLVQIVINSVNSYKLRIIFNYFKNKRFFFLRDYFNSKRKNLYLIILHKVVNVLTKT